MIIIGAFIFAIGLNTFTIANGLAEGGFTGIALLLLYIFNIPIGWTILFLNLPLFILAFYILGKDTLIYTILGTTSSALFVELTSNFSLYTDDLLLAALYSGVTAGIGLGIILRNGGTTAGIDIIARIINKFFNINLGTTIFLFDIFVIILSILFLGSKIAMYSLIGLFITSRIIDFVLEGFNASKAVIIISNKNNLISEKIINNLQRGTTFLDAKGGYTKHNNEMLFCIVNRSEIIKIKHIVRSIDNSAFVIVSNVNEVLGEGFTY